MKAVSLTDHIKYLHCPGEDGKDSAHGVLVLIGADGKPSQVVSIEDQESFKFWYTNYALLEETQLASV